MPKETELSFLMLEAGGCTESIEYIFPPFWSLKTEHEAGRIPDIFRESDDPNRMVPLVWKPEDFLVTVTGDLSRNSIYIFAHNGVLGFPTAKCIALPKNWEQMLPKRT